MGKPVASSREENAKLCINFYSKLFEDLIKSEANYGYEFKGLMQAKIVTSGLISAANKEVCICCSKFSADLWMDPKVFTSLSRALDRNVSFNITSEGPVPKYLEAYLLKHSVQIRYAIADHTEPGNMIISDTRAYTIMNSDALEGLVAFNDPVGAFNLRRPLD